MLVNMPFAVKMSLVIAISLRALSIKRLGSDTNNIPQYGDLSEEHFTRSHRIETFTFNLDICRPH